MKRPGPICFQGISRLLALACVFFALSARAHESSKGYLNLSLAGGRFTGRLEISLRDLQGVVPLGTNQQGAVLEEQLPAHYAEVKAYVLAHLKITVDGQVVAPRFADAAPIVEEIYEGRYLQLNFTLGNFTLPRKLEIGYELFFDDNGLHRGLVLLKADGKTQMGSFSPNQATETFQFGPPTYGRQFVVFLREGVWHIWTGFDHILFLLALLLPSVLRREGGEWREVGALRPAFYNVLKIVTAFTLAHSLTLSLAALGIARLPSRFIESAIALSVVLAAANNLWPLVRERGWIVAFGFGLVHGFGFATALADLGATQGGLALTLVSFNLGVELGQLAIVAVFLPVAFALRRTWLYQTPVLRFGSACVILIASAWCAERVLNLKFMPF